MLDSCASPGSKTQQLLEMLALAAPTANAGAEDRSMSGLLIANDADTKRCHLLASRASRLHSPSLLVTNHDARLIPETLGKPGAAVPLRFDRVLCDVPW